MDSRRYRAALFLGSDPVGQADGAVVVWYVLVGCNESVQPGDEVGFLIGICLILLLQAFLRTKHTVMLEAMAGVPVPARGWVVAMAVLLSSPLLGAAVGLGKEHAWMATAISLAWYFAWCAFIFRRFRRACISRKAP